MHILICSDSFKGSLTSREVSYIIRDILIKKFPKAKVYAIPLADGGEGSINALKSDKGSKIIRHLATDALMQRLQAAFLLFPESKHAVIELAQTCGLSILNIEDRNCFNTSTYGLGLQILEAMKYDVKSIDLLVGGSATNDLGIGMAAALGYKFFDGATLIDRPCGKDMLSVTRIDKSDYVAVDIAFRVVTDVDNTLLGHNGAAATYGKQKGANEEQLTQLEAGAENIVKLIQENHDVDYQRHEGAGAAGGVGYGAMAFLGASKESGIDYIMDKLGILENIKLADLIITGEGKLDKQTLNGKLISGICKLAKTQGKRVVAVCALSELVDKESQALGLNKVYPLYMTLPEKISRKDTEMRLQKITAQLIIDHLE